MSRRDVLQGALDFTDVHSADPGQTTIYDQLAAVEPLVLPSGSTVSADTWDAVVVGGGDWRVWLDERDYSPADADALDALAQKS